MRLSEIEVARRAGTVMRVARKQAGVSQRQIATLIDVSQSKYAKMELGQLIPNIREWKELRQILDLPDHCFETGLIDRNSAMEPLEKSYSGNFHIPARYANNRGSRVRIIRNLLDSFTQIVGENHVLEYIKGKQLDPDFFYDLDHQINLQFVIDLIAHWNSVASIQENHIHQICKIFGTPDFSGYRWLVLPQKDPAVGNAMVSLVDAVQYWERNFEYHIETGGRTWADFSVEARPHLCEMESMSEFNSFACSYRRCLLKYFGKFVFNSNRGSLEVLEQECVNHGDSRCIYKIIKC